VVPARAFLDGGALKKINRLPASSVLHTRSTGNERTFDRSGPHFWVGLASLVGFLAAVSGALVVGCSGGGSSPEPEEVAVARSAYTDNDTGGLYVEDCNALGVPTPPSWGTADIGAPGVARPGSRPALTRTRTRTTPNSTGRRTTRYRALPRTLVLNAHVAGESNGAGALTSSARVTRQTCFWEGYESPTPPSTPVAVLKRMDPGERRSRARRFLSELPQRGRTPSWCTMCPVHPLNLTGLRRNAGTNVRPGGRERTLQNPGPDPFTNYPASNEGAGACLNCHKSGGPGGAFPS